MSITRHTGYNLFGALVPMLVGVITVPAYLRLIGNDRYGVLSIVWLFLGYFGLFDPGITRAAVYHMARLGGDEQATERESIFWTALVVNLCFGVLGGVILYLLARPLFMTTFKMPEAMRVEVMRSLPLMAASIPISIVTFVLTGAFEARERFGLYNVFYVVTALLVQLVPLAVAFWHGPQLFGLIASVLVSRCLGTVLAFAVLIRTFPLFTGGRFSAAQVKPLFSYGGWVTLSNLINPVLGSMDRMLVGSVLNAAAVAFYTVPFNLVSRLSILPGSLVSSLFPRLTRGSEEDSSRLASDAVLTLSAVMTPVVVAAIAALPLFMRLWVGQAFALHAVPVGVAMLVGVWINSLALVPSAHLNAINRPDLPAKFHAYELVPFLGVLWFSLHTFGLLGAAWAWTLRVAVDATLLFFVAGKIPGWQRMLPGGCLVLAACIFLPRTPVSLAGAVEVLLLALSLVWAWQTSPVLRTLVRGRLFPSARKQTA